MNLLSSIEHWLCPKKQFALRQCGFTILQELFGKGIHENRKKHSPKMSLHREKNERPRPLFAAFQDVLTFHYCHVIIWVVCHLLIAFCNQRERHTVEIYTSNSRAQECLEHKSLKQWRNTWHSLLVHRTHDAIDSTKMQLHNEKKIHKPMTMTMIPKTSKKEINFKRAYLWMIPRWCSLLWSVVPVAARNLN